MGRATLAEEARALADWLLRSSAAGFSGRCWGYNFDWQSRYFFAPKGTPNAICSIFAANALLDAFEEIGNESYFEAASSVCDFLENDLLCQRGGEAFIGYVPGDGSRVHNVNLLGAALLARVYAHSGQERLRQLAREVVAFSIQRQGPDGSWAYGEEPGQRWVDNFHSGYNLVALARYVRWSGDRSVIPAVSRGYQFWDRNLFLPDGTPKYYSAAVYPIDTHSAAQAILTYLEFAPADAGALEKACGEAAWSLEHLRSRTGLFYYQKLRWYTNRVCYLRWTQAWMFYALAALCRALGVPDASLD